MSAESQGERLKYLRNQDLRSEIAYATGGDPSRYATDRTRKLRKADIVRIAEIVRPEECPLEPALMNLAELYPHICEWVGGDWNANAGQPWGIDRANLKLIHQHVDGRPPNEVPV